MRLDEERDHRLGEVLQEQCPHCGVADMHACRFRALCTRAQFFAECTGGVLVHALVARALGTESANSIVQRPQRCCTGLQKTRMPRHHPTHAVGLATIVYEDALASVSNECFRKGPPIAPQYNLSQLFDISGKHLERG